MRHLSLLAVVIALAACAPAQPLPSAPSAARAAVLLAPTGVPYGSIVIADISTPVLKPVGNRLDWTDATVRIAVRNTDSRAREAELIVWFTVQPPGLHGPGWGERTAYKRVLLQIDPQASAVTEVIIRDVHAGARVTIDRSYVRQIDGQPIDSRALDQSFEE